MKLAGSFLGGLLAGLLAATMAIILLPVVAGWRPYTVLTGSMEPVISPGDVVMTLPVAARELRIDDVVTFSDPSRAGKLVTHRVRSLRESGGNVEVETRGDANNASEFWAVAAGDRLGRVVFVLPVIGHAGDAIRTPAGLLLLVVLPALGLGFVVIRWIWRDDDEGDGAGHGDPEPPPGATLPAPAGDARRPADR